MQATRRGGAVLAEPEAVEDGVLVAEVREGDDRAFEVLFARYQPRIQAFVARRTGDGARAEDITQEVFVAALRRMRETDRPIAFKPWIYEIAKNATIDAHRRAKRGEEVSYDAEDRLSAADYGRLVAGGPQPDAALALKQELDDLFGALGGLSDTQHDILVLRELEGRSYADIGARLGMSRPAVESTLFRARKRLGEEYAEYASGARCARVQEIVLVAGEKVIGTRDQRRMSRHVSHCPFCRRFAAQAGVDVPRTARRRLADKAGAWLPIPAILRRGGGDHVAAQAALLADAGGSAWPKAAAGLAALLLMGGGVGAGTLHQRDESALPGAPAREAPAPSTQPASSGASVPGTGATGGELGSGAPAAAPGARPPSPDDGPGGQHVPGATQGPAGSGGAPLPADPRGSGVVPGTGDAVKGTGDAVRDTGDAVTDGARDVVDETTGAVRDATDGVTDTVDDTVDGTTDAVDGAVRDAGEAVDGVAGSVGDVVDDVVSGGGAAVEDTTGAVTDTVRGGAGAAADAVDDTTDAVEDTTGAASDAVGRTAGGASDAVDRTAGAGSGTVNDTAGGASGTVNNTAGAASDTVNDTAGTVTDGLGGLG